MNLRETAAILAMVTALDGRKAFGEIDAQAWQAVLEDLRFDDCRDAVIQHYRDSSYTIMPADVRNRVKTVRSARIGTKQAPLPPVEPSDIVSYQQWQQAWYKGVGDGLTDEEAEGYADADLGIIRPALEAKPRNLDLSSIGRKP